MALVAQFEDVVSVRVEPEKTVENTDEGSVNGKFSQVKIAAGTTKSVRLQADHILRQLPITLVVGEPQASWDHVVQPLNARPCGPYPEIPGRSRIVFLTSAKGLDPECGVVRQTECVFQRDAGRGRSRLRTIKRISDIA